MKSHFCIFLLCLLSACSRVGPEVTSSDRRISPQKIPALSQELDFSEGTRSDFQGSTTVLDVPPFLAEKESHLKIHYDLSCRKNASIGKVSGRLTLSDRTVAFFLFEGPEEAEIHLSRLTTHDSSLRIELDSNPECAINHLQYDIRSNEVLNPTDEKPLDRMAALHAPFLVYGDFDGEIPIALAYTLQQNLNGNLIITYLGYFADNSGWNLRPATHGRFFDIRRVYRVILNPQLQPIEHLYFEKDQTSRSFSPRFLKDSLHALILLDRTTGGALAGYHFIPKLNSLLKNAQSPEWYALWNPWIFWAADEELQKKASGIPRSDQFLYVQIEGILDETKPNSIEAQVSFSEKDSASKIFSTQPAGQGIQSLGREFFSRQAFTAIQVPPRALEMLRLGRTEGSFTLNVKNGPSTLKLTNVLRFFTLKAKGRGYETIEVSRYFSCSGADGSVRCQIMPKH